MQIVLTLVILVAITPYFGSYLAKVFLPEPMQLDRIFGSPEKKG